MPFDPADLVAGFAPSAGHIKQPQKRINIDDDGFLFAWVLASGLVSEFDGDFNAALGEAFTKYAEMQDALSTHPVVVLKDDANVRVSMRREDGQVRVEVSFPKDGPGGPERVVEFPTPKD